jgi:hypothetical protein
MRHFLDVIGVTVSCALLERANQKRLRFHREACGHNQMHEPQKTQKARKSYRVVRGFESSTWAGGPATRIFAAL